MALTSCGEYVLPSTSMLQSVPMWRLTLATVRCGFMACWRAATVPTRRSPSFVKATTDGVVRMPSALVMTVARPPSMVATQLLVVPRSMPITAIAHPLLRPWCLRFSQLYPRRVTQR